MSVSQAPAVPTAVANDRSRARPLWLQPAAALIGLALLVAVVHFVFLVSDYRHLFVHPDYYRYILQENLRDGPSIGPWDVLDMFQLRAGGESRPRFLAYFIGALDQKLRLGLYDWLPVHPTLAPLAWFLQLVVAPYCLYRLLVNITEDRLAALAGVAVFITGTGFLSGFTMALLQGKTLSNMILIVALWAASEAARKLAAGQLLAEAPGWHKYLMLVILFLGLFIDELPIAAFAILPLFFVRQFIPFERAGPRVGAFIRNGLFFAIPVVAFVIAVIMVIPPLTERYFDYRFDYLGNTLLIDDNTRGATSYIQGPYATLTPAIVLDNVTTLFGLSLAPWYTSPLIQSAFGNYPGSQVDNLPKLITFAVFFASLIALAVVTRGPFAWHLRGLLASVVVFFLFLSFLQIRHIPVATGFYYGASFAALFALLVAMLVKGAALISEPARIVAAVAVLAIVGIQIVNFGPVNDGWIVTHNEMLTRPAYQDQYPLTPPGDLTSTEVRSLWDAWKQHDLDGYVQQHGVSPNALYEVFELHAIDRFRN